MMAKKTPADGAKPVKPKAPKPTPDGGGGGPKPVK